MKIKSKKAICTFAINLKSVVKVNQMEKWRRWMNHFYAK